MTENEISRIVVEAAMRVHSVLGPGLLESAYQACLVHELRNAGLDVKTEVRLPVEYRGIKIDAGYRIDVLVADSVVLELKCIEEFAPIHTAQLLSYLKLSGKKLGLILNFHVVHLKNGIKRVVNGLNDSASFASSAV